jgi:hypothetical protein
LVLFAAMAKRTLSLDLLFSFAPFGFASGLLGQAKRKERQSTETRGKTCSSASRCTAFSILVPAKRNLLLGKRNFCHNKKAPIGSGLSIIKRFFISSA